MQLRQFYDTYYPNAIEACAGTSFFPEEVIADAALESGTGGSFLTQEALNFFGIKSTPSWEANGGQFVVKPTHETINGQDVVVSARFRKYATATDSFKDYIHFISGPRYIAKGDNSAPTPEAEITDIAAAGYATDPNYAAKVIAIIEEGKGFAQADTTNTIAETTEQTIDIPIVDELEGKGNV